MIINNRIHNEMLEFYRNQAVSILVLYSVLC